MPSKPNFFTSLLLPGEDEIRAARAAGEEVPGPVARGPMELGDKMHWVYVWIIQNGDDMQGHTWAAAAYGEHPEEEHSESSEASSNESPPLEGESWEVPTEMAHPGDNFEEGPAIATSMALVERKEGCWEFYWWTEAFLIRSRL
jgi:hypothetical protein